MKKTSRIVLVAIVTTFIFSAFGVTQAKAQILNKILDRMDQYNKTLQTLQADITMKKHDALLQLTDTTDGTLKYLPKTKNRKMYARIDWTKPALEHIAVIGDEYTLYRPKVNQVYVGKTGKTKNKVPAGTLSFMSMSKAQLKNNYTVKFLGEEKVEGGAQTWHLELTPKNQANYRLAHIWVNKDGLPVMVKVVEKNDDSTTILLTAVKENQTLKAEVFVIDYPRTIKPIQG